MMKLSIIVPIYGVEPYLRKCVDSLLAQDLLSSEYEIILVDDGSPDGCPAICDEYARKSQESRAKSQELPYIRVIHRKNGGLSAARNSGIEIAQGKYIMFVDSDDYIEPNVLGGLMAQVERDNLDVLRFDYQNVRLTNERYEVFEPYKHSHRLENDYSDVPLDGITFLDTRTNYQCYAVVFIMRREIVPKFTEGIHFEDVEWLPRMMMNVERVASADTIVYNYLIREGSITHVQGNKEKNRKNIEDRLLIMKKYQQYRELYPKCTWLRNMHSSMACGVITQVAHEFFAERKEYIRRVEEMNVFPLSIANQGCTYMRRARLINTLGSRIYCAIMHMRR